MQNLAWYAKCVWVMSVWVNHQATAFAHQDRKRRNQMGPTTLASTQIIDGLWLALKKLVPKSMLEKLIHYLVWRI